MIVAECLDLCLSLCTRELLKNYVQKHCSGEKFQVVHKFIPQDDPGTLLLNLNKPESSPAKQKELAKTAKRGQQNLVCVHVHLFQCFYRHAR